MNKQPTYKINDLEYPSSDKITSRISTLRRSMACTLMNRDACTLEQEQVWLKYFPDNKCAYCGQEATHLDHLHPMIRDNEPTGFGTDPGNLVPCCKNCNTPKGNMAWADFMRSSKCKHMEKPNKTLQESIDERIQNISDFQREMPARYTHIEPTMKQQWKELWCNLEQLLKQTQDELMDMKRQLYGNSASGNQTGTTTPKSGRSGVRKITADEFSEFKAFVGTSSADGYCTSVRAIMKEMGINTAVDFEQCIDSAIDYCTQRKIAAITDKEKKRYSDRRSHLRQYKKYLESRKLHP